MQQKALYGTLLTMIVVVAVVVVVVVTMMSRRDDGIGPSTTDEGERPTAQEIIPDFSGELLPNEPVDPEAATPESPAHGARLVAVAGNQGSGIAARHFDGETFVHVITADLPQPPAGRFYEGWLVKPGEGSPQFISTGQLEFQDPVWKLLFRSEQHYLDHPQIIVTLESEANGLDNVPEKHILEGDFGV